MGHPPAAWRLDTAVRYAYTLGSVVWLAAIASKSIFSWMDSKSFPGEHICHLIAFALHVSNISSEFGDVGKCLCCRLDHGSDSLAILTVRGLWSVYAMSTLPSRKFLKCRIPVEGQKLLIESAVLFLRRAQLSAEKGQ